jgi:VWFA-related protein
MSKNSTVKTAILALAMAMLARFVPGQSPPLQMESREVQVDVIVTAKKGAATNGLAAKDFSVQEDSKVQTINSVQAADPEASLQHVALYFDAFTSEILPDDQQTMEKAAESFIHSVASPHRYISVMSVTALESARVLQDFTTSPAPLVRAVADRFANWPPFTGRHYSIGVSLAAVCHSMDRAPGDKTLIVFGNYNLGWSYDGRGMFDTYRPDVDPPTSRAIQACNQANVRVYAVVVPTIMHFLGGLSREPHDEKRIAPPRSELAEQTGGLAFGITSALKDQLAAIAREQGHYYRLFYTPPPSGDGVCHRLLVSINARDLSARARNGYCTGRQPDTAAAGTDRWTMPPGRSTEAPEAPASGRPSACRRHVGECRPGAILRSV